MKSKKTLRSGGAEGSMEKALRLNSLRGKKRPVCFMQKKMLGLKRPRPKENYTAQREEGSVNTNCVKKRGGNSFGDSSQSFSNEGKETSKLTFGRKQR